MYLSKGLYSDALRPMPTAVSISSFTTQDTLLRGRQTTPKQLTGSPGLAFNNFLKLTYTNPLWQKAQRRKAKPLQVPSSILPDVKQSYLASVRLPNCTFSETNTFPCSPQFIALDIGLRNSCTIIAATDKFFTRFRPTQNRI